MNQQGNNTTNEDDYEVELWGDYIHSLDDDRQQDLNGNRAITDGIAGVDLHATVDNAPCVTIVRKGDGHGDVLTEGYVQDAQAGAFNLRQRKIACNTMNKGSSSSKTTALSLMQWIPHAVKASGSNGYTSPLYVASAMKIALAITKDIVEAENLYLNYCIPDKLDMLPLTEKDPAIDCRAADAQSSTGSNQDIEDAQVEEFLKQFEQQRISRQEQALRDQAQAYSTRNSKLFCDEDVDAQSSAGSNQDIEDAKLEFLKQFEQERISRQEQALRDQAQASGQNSKAENGVNDVNTPSSSSHLTRNSKLFCDEDVNWFNVKSARIKCPEGNLRSNHDNGSKQRMFYLGLLLYELFSGGQTPPPNLCALASSIGAFVSISKTTLAQRSNNEAWAASTGKRLQSVNQDNGLCKVNCEYLKLINVTNSLCHLIFHMLDCVYGDFADEDSYSNLTEVEFDLQLMMDQPKFLLGLNMDTCSQLNDICIPREQEVQTILSCYRRSISNAPEIAIVKGVSGAGKSFLAQLIGSTVASEGGIFLMGKFDQMQQSRPFSGLAAALDQYCDVLISQLGSYWANTVVNNLQAALGRDASYLMMIIPKLSVILSNANYPPPIIDGDLRNAVQRIQYLLCQFVETISSTSMVSVTICLDDVQWMDDASISVVKQVLAQGYNKFFFMACFRHDEMSNAHLFWSMIESARSHNVILTSVELKNIDIQTLENCMSDLLCISPRLVKPLASIVHTKTKGLPLFVSEMLRSLVRDGLLRVDFECHRWVWNRETIYAAKLPDNVALCFINNVAKLPSEVQLALNALSMFGSSVKSMYIKALEARLNINLTEPLKVAINEGLVSEIKGSYQFSHDRIKETCYSMIQEQDRALKHLIYGRCLAKLAMETNNDDAMFISVTQINLGGPAAITEWDDYIIMAKHNLKAGKKAIETSDFSLAYNLFHNGVAFLPPQHWHHHPAISLELHECAARAALATGNVDNTRRYSEIVLQNTKRIDDKMYIQHIVMLSLIHTLKMKEALELGLSMLSQLGEGISRSSAENDFVEQSKRTQTMIAGITEDDILGYKPMIDKRKYSAMKFLASLHNCSLFFADISLHGLIVLKMVQLTITYGISKQSPIGLALFGALLCNLGNIPVGHRFSLLAMALLGKPESKDVAGEVMCMVSSVKCLVEPLQALNELQSQAESASSSAGDVQYACWNRILRCSYKFWAGTNLSDVNEEFAHAIRFIRGQDHKAILAAPMMFQSAVSILVGNKTEAEFDLENSERTIAAPRHMLNRDDTQECGKTYYELDEVLNRLSEQMVVGEFVIRALPPGLAAFRLYRETKDSVWLKRGQKCKEKMQVWSEQGCKWNFEHKYLLLTAEESYCLCDFAAAKEYYKKAIAAAKSHKFLNDECFALELAANFYFETGDLPVSLEHFKASHARYCDWGAYDMANQLFQQISDKFVSGYSSNSFN